MRAVILGLLTLLAGCGQVPPARDCVRPLADGGCTARFICDAWVCPEGERAPQSGDSCVRVSGSLCK